MMVLFRLAIVALLAKGFLSLECHAFTAGNSIRETNAQGKWSQPWSPEANAKLENEGDEESLKANRFSKFAPSADLEADEFREQLKANMKADLERRRQADPNRGNQVAKSYLDSLK